MSVMIIDGALTYGIEADGTAFVAQNPDVQLSDVVIPATIMHGGTTYSVTAVGSKAFRRNRTLTSVKFAPDSQVRVFGELAFEKTNLVLLQIPASLTSIHKSAFKHTPRLTQIDLQGGNTFVVDDGILYSHNYTELLFVPRNRSGPFTIRASVKIVGEYAFACCSRLREVDFENGSEVKILNEGAFTRSGITRIKIPAGVTRLGDWCFANCHDLMVVTFLSK
jgi:hypothetical protein